MRKLIAVFCIGLFAALAVPAIAQPTDVPSLTITQVDYGSTALQTNAGAVCEMACPSIAAVPVPSHTGIPQTNDVPAYAAVRLLWIQSAGLVPDKSTRS